MIIPQTQNAIKFYELAIENAQAQLAFQVNQDVEYQNFRKRFRSIGTTLFHPHTMSFDFYDYNNDVKKEYFTISGGDILLGRDSSDVEAIGSAAQELLNIVKKFY